MQLDSLFLCGRNTLIDFSQIENLGSTLTNRFELRHEAINDNPDFGKIRWKI